MKEKKRIHSTLAIFSVTTILFVFLFFFITTLFINIVAQNYYQIIGKEGTGYVHKLTVSSGLHDYAKSMVPNQNLPGSLEYYFLRTIEAAKTDSLDEITKPKNSLGLTNPENASIHTAVLITDETNSIVLSSGNYIYFSYNTEENWKNEKDTTVGYSYINLDKLPEDIRNSFVEKKEILLECEKNEFDLDATAQLAAANRIRKMRIVGFFKDTEFIPVTIDIVNESYMNENLIRNSNSFMHNDLQGYVEWNNIYDVSIEESNDYITIYANDTNITIYQDRDKTLHNLMKGRTFLSKENAMPDSISDIDYFNENNTLDFLSVMDSETHQLNGKKYNIATAVSGHPLDIAKSELFYMKQWLLILFVILWLSINILIYKKLIYPVILVNNSFKDNFSYIWKDKEAGSFWREQYDLVSHYLDVRNGNFKHRTETKELKNALSDSTKAQADQKKKVTNLAHDLKNPMSIIYTYSEALKENIGEDKSEEYYEVILSEIKHMEHMVVDMLDLSREKEV